MLRYRTGQGGWQSIPLPEGNLLVGRRAGCGLQLRGSLVSREHAELRRRGEQVWLVDLGSSNGTRIGEIVLVEQLPQLILPGQTITIGEYTLELESPQARPIVEQAPPPSERAVRHVFISYSRRDKEIVHPMANKLEAYGINVWMDTQDIKPGAPWRGQIVQAIAEADSFLLLMSPDACASENVCKELDLAIEADVLVIPVVIQPVQIPATLKYQLVGIQRIDLLEEPAAGFAQLVAAIRERQEYLARHPVVRPREMQAELVLPKASLSDFYHQKQQQLINFLAQVTNTSPSAIRIAGAVPGSLRVTVVLPTTAAYELKAQALNSSPAFGTFGISSLRLVGDKQFIHFAELPPTPPGGSPPSAPAAPAPGSGILRILLWTLGAIGLIVIGLFIAPEIFPPEAPVTSQPPVVETHIPAGPSTRTPRPRLTPTRTPTQPKIVKATSTRTKTPTTRPPLTWTPSPTVFVCASSLTVQMNAHCRYGPGTVYDILTSLQAGVSAQIEGKNDNQPARWWWIQLPNSRAHCWISDTTVTTTGQPECVHIIPAPPTPTPTPQPNLPPPVPALISPVADAPISCESSLGYVMVDFSWSTVNDPEGIARYEWVVESIDSYGAASEFDSGSTQGTSIQLQMSCYLYYRWRVRAVDGTGLTSDYSPYATFDTDN